MNQSVMCRHFPGEQRQPSTAPLVLLHGWGSDARSWEPLIPQLCRALDVIVVDLPGFGDTPPCQSWQQAVDSLANVLPAKFSVFGWSLGGMLAVQLAHQFPGRVDKLITLASNASFVNRSNWTTAMPVGIFDEFFQGFVADPDTCRKQFSGLQARGDSEERKLVRWFRANSPQLSPGTWLYSLEWLRQLDNREPLAKLKIPSLHIYGQGDQLVPVAAAKKVAGLSKHIRIQIIEGAGHAPHLSKPREIADLVLEFLDISIADSRGDMYQLRKEQIAASFSRAAASYDAVAGLQRQVGETLLAHLPAEIQPRRIADMGCGTGHFTARLASRFPGSRCIGIDLSPGMLDYAAGHRSPGKQLQWLCGDAEALQMQDCRFDLIFSNFSFQWCQDLNGLMAEQWRVLNPGGLLAFTTVGPKTLWQLKGAWQMVDDYVHVNEFIPLEDVRNALETRGFQVETWREETVTRFYSQLSDLTGELKALGAHNLNTGRNNGLTGRKQILALKSAYETLRTGKGLPSDWQILYVVARKEPAKG